MLGRYQQEDDWHCLADLLRQEAETMLVGKRKDPLGLVLDQASASPGSHAVGIVGVAAQAAPVEEWVDHPGF
jgi:hypothetical protein